MYQVYRYKAKPIFIHKREDTEGDLSSLASPPPSAIRLYCQLLFLSSQSRSVLRFGLLCFLVITALSHRVVEPRMQLRMGVTGDDFQGSHCERDCQECVEGSEVRAIYSGAFQIF